MRDYKDISEMATRRYYDNYPVSESYIVMAVTFIAGCGLGATLILMLG